MRTIMTTFAFALSFAAISCNQPTEPEGIARRGSSVTSNASPGDILLTWTGGDNAVASYDIFFGTTQAGTFKKVAALTSFNKAAPEMALGRDDVGVDSGDPACFYVVAVNAKGSSQPSEKVCGTVP